VVGAELSASEMAFGDFGVGATVHCVPWRPIRSLGLASNTRAAAYHPSGSSSSGRLATISQMRLDVPVQALPELHDNR